MSAFEDTALAPTCPIFTSMRGRKAVATSAENHIRNFVRELFSRMNRIATAMAAVMRVPSARQYKSRANATDETDSRAGRIITLFLQPIAAAPSLAGVPGSRYFCPQADLKPEVRVNY